MGSRGWAVTGVLAAFVGFVIGYLLLNGVTPVPARARWQWVLVFAPVVAVLAVVEVFLLGRGGRAGDERRMPFGRLLGVWGARLVVLGVMIVLTLGAKWADYQPEPWGLGQSVVTVLVYLGVSLGVLGLLDRASREMGPFLLGAGLSGWVGASSFVILFGASANLSQMTGALASALGAVCLATLLPGGASHVSRGVTTFCVPLVLVLCLNGTYYGSTQPQWLALLAAGALALGLGRFWRSSRLEGRRLDLARLAVMAVFLGGAVFLGYREYMGPEPDNQKETGPTGINYESYYGG
jgi:hypothetical protein